MENIKEYIESGVLELYVLGDISAEEKLQVEAMAAAHADVKKEIEEIERSMEFYAEEHAVEPSEALRGRILNSLITNLGDDSTFSKARNYTEEVFEDDARPVNNVVQIQPRQSSFFKYAFAACLVLLLISVYGMVNLYSKLQESSTQLTALQLDKQKIVNQVNERDSELGLYRDSSFRVYRLKGTAKAPKAAMTLAWSPVKQKVVLDLKSLNLPDNDKQHQYQLWAIVAGKPVDLGVFDKASEVDTSSVKEMKSVANAEMFAVTVEPTGGSVNPTLTEMLVAGK